MAQWFFRITAYADALIADLRHDRLARAHEEDPARPHRPLRGRRGAVPRRRARPRHPGLHDAARHAVRRDVLRDRAGVTAGRRCWSTDRQTTRCCSYARIAGCPPDRGAGDAREDRRLHRALRDEPGQRRAAADLGRRLRADGVRHRRDHGRARARRARPRVRRDVRPADPARDRRGREADRLRRVRRAPVARRESPRSSTGSTSAASARPRSTTACTTGASRASGTGAARSRSSTASEHGIVGVPEDELPVLLPDVDDYQPKGKPPLASNPEFINTTCPKCGGPAKREADTMDTFVDSSWYFLRYTDPHNDDAPFNREIVDYWMPIDQYVGGIDHVKGHLLYSRFFAKVLNDLGLRRVPRAVPAAVAPGLGEAGRLEDVEVARERLRPGRADRGCTAPTRPASASSSSGPPTRTWTGRPRASRGWCGSSSVCGASSARPPSSPPRRTASTRRWRARRTRRSRASATTSTAASSSTPRSRP